MKFFDDSDTKVFALGGLGEVGKNMYCVMTGNEIIITGKTTESHIYNGMHEYLDEIESEKVKVYKINRPESNN